MAADGLHPRDLRMMRPVRRYKGHQNSCKNFVRARFGPQGRLVVGGSEDGGVYMWSTNGEQLVQRLTGHRAVAYEAVWNEQRSLLASCSHDGTAITWTYDPDKPLLFDEAAA